MDLKGVGEAGLSAVVEGLAKVRGAIPEEAIAKAEEAMSKADSVTESPLGKQVFSLVGAAAAQSEAALEKAVDVAAAARDRAASARAMAAEAATAARDRVTMASAAKETNVGSEHSKGPWVKVAVASVAATVAAGAGYAVWRRRQGAEAPVQPEEGFEPGVADEQGPEAADQEFAHEVDEAAEEIAEEIVEAVEGAQEPSEGAPPAEGGEHGADAPGDTSEGSAEHRSEQ